MFLWPFPPRKKATRRPYWPAPQRRGMRWEERRIRKKGERSSILISVKVWGSPGPIRLVASEDDVVADVIRIALESYAREGRLPVLGSGLSDFVLYNAYDGSSALSPPEKIGYCGGRHFLLCRRTGLDGKERSGMADRTAEKKGKGGGS